MLGISKALKKVFQVKTKFWCALSSTTTALPIIASLREQARETGLLSFWPSVAQESRTSDTKQGRCVGVGVSSSLMKQVESASLFYNWSVASEKST